MSGPDRCDISTMVVESMARPIDQASATFPDPLPGGIGVVGELMDADATGPARSAMAKSELCLESLERRLAFDAPIHGCRARTANPSDSRLGAVVATQGTYYPGFDNASVSRDQLEPNGTADRKKRSGRPASTSIPIPRRAPKQAWQRKAVARRPRNRGGRSARELFNNVPRTDRSRGLQGFLYAGGHLNISYLWQDNRILGLDAYDWFILLGGAVLSGAIVLLS
jgi:hypothetical protein